MPYLPLMKVRGDNYPDTGWAPDGLFIGRVVHVELDWTFLGNKKAALYFEIIEGLYTGIQARLFYRLGFNDDGEVEISPKSKLANDFRKLFPDEAAIGNIDLELFKDKIFQITVKQIILKEGDINAIVTKIEPPDVGF